MMVEIRQLEYFQMVAKLNNITRAAEKLHVSQPSITNAIQKLEKELKVVLLDRSKRHLQLTPEGEVFLKRIDYILEKINSAIIEMHDLSNATKGCLSIGIPPMIGTYLFPYILSNFTKEYPGIKLNISEKGSLQTREMIENGNLDLGIVIISEPSDSLETLPISKSEILVCLSSDHPLSKRSSIGIRDLANEPIIMLKEGFYHRNKIFERFDKYNIKPNIILSSNQLETIKSLTANGVGISFLLKDIIQSDSRITSAKLSESIDVSIGLAWKKDKYVSKATQAFINFIINDLDFD